MNTKIPFYAKASLIFIGLFAFVGMLYIAQRIIVPIIFATIIAIVVSPLVDFFVSKKMNRVWAISVSITLIGIATLLFIMLLYSQINIFTESFPILMEKTYKMLDRLVLWTSRNFNISALKLNSFIADTKSQLLSGSQAAIGATLISVGNALVLVFLIPVYVFMILFYQPLLLDFIGRIFGSNNREKVADVLLTTKTIIRKYLVALLLEASIIAILNSAGLLIIGIDYAIILGIMGAIINIVPYIGGIVAVALPMMVAFVTKSSLTYVLLVIAVYVVIQFIDNHYIIPKVVASKVKINALVSIIVVLAGGALWGIPGMFLSIPLTAILKVICDHIDELKSWGFLLGDTIPTITVFKLKLKKKQ